MAVVIQNLKLHKPLALALNSGHSLLLAPGGQSPELRDAEVENNPKVRKLIESQCIAVHQTGKKERAAGGAQEARRAKKTRKK